MSVVGQAMVMIVARALAGRTWAGERVFEQPINPLNMAFQGNPETGEPAIAVYVEDVEAEPRHLEIQRGSQELGLKIISYAPPTVVVQHSGQPVEFNHDGAGLVLNTMQRQILSALQHGNSNWVTLFRGFVAKALKRRSRFLLIEFDDGVRLPSLEIALTVEVLPEPELAKPLYGLWSTLDTALRAEGTTVVADLLKQAIENPAGLPDWQRLQIKTNLSDAAYLAAGLAPLVVDEDGEAVTLEEVTSDIEIEIVPPAAP